MVADYVVWKYYPNGRPVGVVKFVLGLIVLALCMIALTGMIAFFTMFVGLLIFGPDNGPDLGIRMGVILGALIAIGFIYLIIKQSDRRHISYELTNSKALIRVKESVVNECALKNCSVLVMNTHQSHWGTASGYESITGNINSSYSGRSIMLGDVIFREGGVAKLTFSNVRDPDRLMNLANQIISESISKVPRGDNINAATHTGNGSELEKITRLKSLMDSGAITRAEFEEQKQRILDTIAP